MLLHKFNRDRFSLIRNLLVIPVTVLMFFALAVHGQTPGTAEAKPSPNPRSNASANVRANANVQANARSSSNVTVIAHRSSTSRVSDRNSNGEEAKFPGGEEAWRKYLFTAVHYPIEAQDKEIQGTVVVQFKVAADGTTTEVTALSGPKEGGLKEEAVRLVKGSGKWMPAVKNGKPVASTKKQPIIFRLESQ